MQSADFTCLNIKQGDKILRIRIDHPTSELNTVDDALHHDLTALFRQLKQEPEPRAILLTGTGRAFSAGGDFNWFKTLRTPQRLAHLNRDAKQMIWDLLDVEVPIVTAVNGYAMGLGASIALLSDVVFMAESATIADSHVRAGLVAGDGGVVAWPWAVGPARAKEHLLTGDPVSATDAERMGMVNHVVPDDQLEEQSLAFAQRLASAAPMAVRYTKLSVNKLIKESLNAAFDCSTGYELTTFMSDDHVEAIDAFLEKRPPRFNGH